MRKKLSDLMVIVDNIEAQLPASMEGLSEWKQYSIERKQQNLANLRKELEKTMSTFGDIEIHVSREPKETHHIWMILDNEINIFRAYLRQRYGVGGFSEDTVRGLRKAFLEGHDISVLFHPEYIKVRGYRDALDWALFESTTHPEDSPKSFEERVDRLVKTLVEQIALNTGVIKNSGYRTVSYGWVDSFKGSGTVTLRGETWLCVGHQSTGDAGTIYRKGYIEVKRCS